MAHFKNDLFISYAHLDNKLIEPANRGWISHFHASLEALLSMRLGRTAKIWRDDKLQGIDIFSDEIIQQLAHTRVFLSIMSDSYVKSEWCTREVHKFCEQAEQSGGVVIDNKARIFKIIKFPVDTQEFLPTAIKDMLGYEFYIRKDGEPEELHPAFGDELAQDFNRKVGKLAWDISQLLKQLATDAETSGKETATPAAPKATVYLAECSYDRKEIREILESDLRCHGYTVLPDQQLPRDEAGYVAAVEALLARSKFSIHLIGESYGAVPDGLSQKSVVVLQNEVAVNKSKNSAFPRIIWLPEATASAQLPQQSFIEALHQDAEVQFGADLITGDLEALKASIHATLKKLEQPEPRQHEVQADAANATQLIYLICNEKDRKATLPIRKFLREQGCEVSLPAFDGDATGVREAHRQLMSNCDAVIVFYGNGSEAWKRTIDSELKKMPGYRNGKPLLACFTYLAEPVTADKEDLIDMEESNLIDGIKDFSQTGMTAFMQAMKSGGAKP